jgi:hypothetical protein
MSTAAASRVRNDPRLQEAITLGPASDPVRVLACVLNYRRSGPRLLWYVILINNLMSVSPIFVG